jgi:hypothetical protein
MRVQLVMFVYMLVTVACGGSTTPPPEATIVAAPLPTDWQRIDLPRITLALPPEWAITSPEDIDGSEATTEMAAQNPQLKTLLEQGRVALQSGQVQIIAYDVAPERADESGFPTNLRIGQQQFAQAPTLNEVSDANEQQLRTTAGFSNVQRAGVLLGGTPATRLQSSLQINDGLGQPIDLALEQYLLLNGTDLQIVTLTTPARQQQMYRPIFDQILTTLRNEATQ